MKLIFTSINIKKIFTTITVELYRTKEKTLDISQFYFIHHKLKLVEVQGIAHWSLMFITNLVYRHSWKTKLII